MPIPFPPGGPQVQAAIQNPARFPDQQLQQYAQGQQPTGQVPPPLAANELTVRNAQRQAAARQTAMQNNPKQSPTVFQQKDMELQQKAQQLAAMQQQMQQQTQQKEQQLGVMGALLAKKAQDLQARESMGIANLPIRPDMFTAMDGGIVFNGGGAVQRFNGLSSSAVKLGGKSWDELSEVIDEPASSLGELISKPFSRGGKKMDPITGEPITLGEFLRRAEKTGINSSEIDTRDDVTEPPERRNEKTKSSESKLRKENSSSTKTDASSAGVKSVFDQFMNRVAPYNVESDASKELRTGILGGMGRIREAYDKSELTPEKIKEIEDAEKLLRQTEYGEYTKGRQERAEKIRAALEGEAPTFQQRIARGLANIPADIRGVRLGQGLAMLAGGAGQADADYEKRRRDAAKYIADTQELAAQRDLAERRGDRAAARELTDKENARLKSRFETARGFESAQMQGLGSLLGDTRTVEGRQADLAAKGAGLELQTELQKQLEAARAARDANKPTELMRNIKDLAKLMGVSESEAFALLKPPKDTEAFPSAVQAKIYDTVAAKYSNPYSPAVIAAVEAINPEAAKILKLGEKEAKNQRGHGAALAVVEQAMDAELRGRLNKPLNYGVLPAPPSR